MKIAMFDTHAYERESFEAANSGVGHEISFLEPRLTSATAILARSHEVVCSFVSDKLDEVVLQILWDGGTRLVALRSAGYNHVDLTAAARLGLPVVRVPEYSPHAVAEHAVALVLALDRKIHRAYSRVRDWNFSLDGLVGFDLEGKTVGIIGAGRIGRVAARIFHGFGCRLLVHDPVPDPNLVSELAVRYVELPELFRDSDIISLHVPLSPATHHVVNAAALATMKRGVILINTGRGALIDSAALVAALKDGQLGAAGLDVYEEEEGIFFQDLSNRVLQDDVLSRLITFPNVLVTSHQAFLTREALSNIARVTLENVTAFERGETLHNQVRASEVLRASPPIARDRSHAAPPAAPHDNALRVSEAEFASIVAISGDAIISVDEHQRIVIYNEGAEQIFGWSRDEVLGQPLDLLIPDRLREIHRQHIQGFSQEAGRARKMGERGPAIVGRRKNGQEFPADAGISNVQVDGGHLYTVVLRDITAQKLVERNQRFLSEVGAVLGASLDHGETLANLAALSVQFLSDCCVIDVADEESGLWRRKVLHADPTKVDQARALEGITLDRTKPHLTSAVVETRQTTLVGEVTPKHLESIAQNAEHLRILGEINPSSYVALPLIAHGRLLGAMVLIRSGRSQPYGADDVRLAEEVAYRASHAIESARLYRAAQMALQARDQVLSIVAHDLRSPLNAAKLAAGGLLRQHPEGAAGQGVRKAAETIDRAIQRANHLIQDLLDVARIEGGKLVIDRAPVLPSDLLMEAADAFGALASDASLNLTSEAAEPLPDVLADKERVLQVLSNLVGNALKFTPAGGQIRIAGFRRGDEVCFSIADTGPGISAEERAHVFERFWQGRPKDQRGAGLGLPIAKGIVEAHGGRIWVEGNKGAGCTFCFSLPIAPIAGERQRAG